MTVMTPSYEAAFLKCRSFVIGVVYRPPSGSLTDFFASSHIQVVIFGDFNITLLQAGPTVTQFSNIISSNGFINIIDVPTRITPSMNL